MDEKEQYIVEVDRKIGEWDAKTEALRREARSRGAESELLEDLLRKQTEAQDALEELRQSGADVWEELKAAVGVKAQDYQDTLVRASERFGAGHPRDEAHVVTHEEPSADAAPASGEDPLPE